jgi:hypothetical protein
VALERFPLLPTLFQQLLLSESVQLQRAVESGQSLSGLFHLLACVLDALLRQQQALFAA